MIPVIVEDAERLIVAAVVCPGDSVVPCLFQVTVKGPFALVGFQLIAVMLRVNEDAP